MPRRARAPSFWVRVRVPKRIKVAFYVRRKPSRRKP